MLEVSDRFDLQKAIPPSNVMPEVNSLIITKDPAKSFFDQVHVIKYIFSHSRCSGRFRRFQKVNIIEVFRGDNFSPDIVRNNENFPSNFLLAQLH